jgi:hypothetical protein
MRFANIPFEHPNKLSCMAADSESLSAEYRFLHSLGHSMPHYRELLHKNKHALLSLSKDYS